MNNLEILQHVATSVGLAVPENLTDLTRPAREILRVIHNKNRSVCGKRDWWFLQKTGHLQFQELTTGVATAAVTASTKLVTISPAPPFEFTYSKPAKVNIGNAGTDHEFDFLRVQYASTTTGTILGPWEHGDVAAQDWTVGHDEYELVNFADRVSWMVLHYAGGSGTGGFKYLYPVSVDELERLRGGRAEYLWAEPIKGQPEVYCVMLTEADSFNNRRIIVDPFPLVNSQVVYGYYTIGADLYGAGVAEPNIPDEHQHILIYQGILDYLVAYGIGTPANSAAGRDVPQLLEFYNRKLKAAMDELTNHARVAEEQARWGPESFGRMSYAAQTGRII